MEHVINRIIDMDRAARTRVEAQRQKQSQQSEELDKEIALAVQREKTRAEREIEAFRTDIEQKTADQTLTVTQESEKELAALTEYFNKNAAKLENALFAHVIGSIQDAES